MRNKLRGQQEVPYHNDLGDVACRLVENIRLSLFHQSHCQNEQNSTHKMILA